LSLAPEAQRQEIDERASIMEFDGGLQRALAEEAAFSDFARNQTKDEPIN
jgi:hypothetical protein